MTQSETSLIESNPNIMMGKPVIAGTRITVESILEKLASGESREQLLQAHPKLTPEAIDAVLAFAAKDADLLNYRGVIPVDEAQDFDAVRLSIKKTRATNSAKDA